MKIILKSIYSYLFFALIFILPFEEFFRAIPNIFLVVLAIAFPFAVSKGDFKKLNTIPSYLFLAFIVYLIVNSIFLSRFEDNFSELKKIFISLGLIILYLPIPDFKKLNKAIIFSVLIIILISLYNILILIFETGTFEFGDSSNPIHTLLIDRLYLGFLCLLSIIVSSQSITKKASPYYKYYWANIILNVFFVFLIVSRIAIIILIILTLVKIFYGRINKRNAIIGLSLIVLVSVLAFSLNDNIKKRFLFSYEDNEELTLKEKILLWEPRTKIWDCAYIIAEKESSFFSGLGFKETNEQLVECYQWNIENEGRKEWFLLQKYNTHNQFIDFYLSTGIFSVMLFLALFISLAIKNRNSYFLTSFLIAIFFFGFIENFFHRQVGAYYFGVVFLYLLFANNLSQNQIEISKISKEDF